MVSKAVVDNRVEAAIIGKGFKGGNEQTETNDRFPERAAIIRNRLPLDRTMVPVILTLVTSTAHRRHDNVRPRTSTLFEIKLLGKKLLDSRPHRPEAHQITSSHDIRKRGQNDRFSPK